MPADARDAHTDSKRHRGEVLASATIARASTFSPAEILDWGTKAPMAWNAPPVVRSVGSTRPERMQAHCF